MKNPPQCAHTVAAARAAPPGDTSGSERPASTYAKPHPERTAAIMAHRAQGWSLDAIGAAFGISNERVRQIIMKQQRQQRAPRYARGAPSCAYPHCQCHLLWPSTLGRGHPPCPITGQPILASARPTQTFAITQTCDRLRSHNTSPARP
jgi:hypothetical protein